MRVSVLCRVVSVFALATAVACGDGDASGKKADGGSDGGGAELDAGEVDGGDADVDPTPDECPSISFVSPVDGARLAEGDDKDQDSCGNGFQYDVSVATSAADGTAALLFADATLLAESKVSNALVRFEGVQLTANGESLLRVQVGGLRCLASARVTVACSVPLCSIAKPALSPTHPKLNGVPVANGGDRVSSAGSPYQVAVEVNTSVEDGQQVQLAVDNSEVLLTAIARSGLAKFPGVTLAPDGEHSIVATCRAKSGAVGTSSRAVFDVDSAGPDLTITSPANGAHYEQVPSFEVCASSTSTDARDLPSDGASTGGKNLCGAIGAASPVCAAVASAQEGGATIGKGCLQIGCPGGPAFDVTVTLRDAAGNSTSKVLSGITCQTNLPAIEIVSPSSTIDGDPSTRVLAANSTQARKDADPNMLGAQYTVLACTEVQNGSVTLKGGVVDGTLNALGPARTAEAATAQDGCPAGKPYVARFANVTLPESQADGAGALAKATRLVASVTDASSTMGNSLPVDLWVDSVPPALSGSTPRPLCGFFRQSAVAWTTEVSLTTSVLPLQVTFTKPDNSVETKTATTYSLGIIASLGNVTFLPGQTRIAASVTEASGNRSSLSDPCVLTVGNPPIVTWVAPVAGARLGASSDADPNAAGWQGVLRVHTDLTGVTPEPTVTFTTGTGGQLGTATVDSGTGDAVLSNVTLPEGAAVQLTATTSDVPARGQGNASVMVSVDTSVPAPIATVTPTVPPEKRRQTTFHLAWAAPADSGGAAVTGYDVRVSATPINSQAAFDAAESVPYVGVPAQPGQTDGVDVPNRYIERDYYFAVAPVDAGNNRAAFTAAGPSRAVFNQVVLRGAGGNTEQYGRALDGTQSINGDAFADLVVGAGAGNRAYIYFGAADGFANTSGSTVSPAVVITGNNSTQFGAAVRVIGDIDGDGLAELAVSAITELSGATLSGKVYIFKGRATWLPSYSIADASYVVDAPGAAFDGAQVGSALARLGDFDGDGTPDFAISASRYAANRGYVAVVRGVPSGQTFPATLSLGVASPRLIEIEGATGTTGRFGWQVASLGNFYGAGGSAFMASATVEGAALNGRAYAFTPARVTTASPIDLTAQGTANDAIGYAIAPLGALGSPMALAIGAARFTSGSGFVQVHVGNTTTGPFVDNPVVITNAAATTTANSFGACTFGSVNSGVAQSVLDSRNSFLGNTQPDLAISGFAEGTGPARLYLIDGQKIPTMTSADIATLADGSRQLPPDWVSGLGCGPPSQSIPDLNNDGYADIAVSQFQRLNDYAGGVLVLW